MPSAFADRISHILETIDEIERALGGKSLEEFKSDRLLRAAVGCVTHIIRSMSTSFGTLSGMTWHP